MNSVQENLPATGRKTTTEAFASHYSPCGLSDKIWKHPDQSDDLGMPLKSLMIHPPKKRDDEIKLGRYHPLPPRLIPAWPLQCINISQAALGQNICALEHRKQSERRQMDLSPNPLREHQYGTVFIKSTGREGHKLLEPVSSTESLTAGM